MCNTYLNPLQHHSQTTRGKHLEAMSNPYRRLKCRGWSTWMPRAREQGPEDHVGTRTSICYLPWSDGGTICSSRRASPENVRPETSRSLSTRPLRTFSKEHQTDLYTKRYYKFGKRKLNSVKLYVVTERILEREKTYYFFQFSPKSKQKVSRKRRKTEVIQQMN